jgi:uncharacterized cupin superfamily protein
VGLTHFDEAPRNEVDVGHLRSTWSFLGEGAGSVTCGVRRLEIRPDGWSTPCHEHGREEEIFYVLGGGGLSWQDGKTSEIRAGDCVVYRPHRGAHSLHAFGEGLDVLAFGPKDADESVGFPRLGLALAGGRFTDGVAYYEDGGPRQFLREAELGPPELPEPGARPANIVNEADTEDGRLGKTAGAVDAGLNLVRFGPGETGPPPHCHSEEEELFVILEGTGTLELWPSPNAEFHGTQREDHELRAGSVVARPPGTRVAHALRAGPDGMTYLVYGTRKPNDLVFYPRSSKIFFRGLGVMARVEHLDYWDGEPR